MALRTSAEEPGADWPGRRLDHATFAARLAERRRELGELDVPRNDGARRTASKRALLKAIEEAGGKW